MHNFPGRRNLLGWSLSALWPNVDLKEPADPYQDRPVTMNKYFPANDDLMWFIISVYFKVYMVKNFIPNLVLPRFATDRFVVEP